jgi:hypothetical protein
LVWTQAVARTSESDMGSFHISPTLLRATVLRLLQPAKSELVININTARFSDQCLQTYLPWNQGDRIQTLFAAMHESPSGARRTQQCDRHVRSWRKLTCRVLTRGSGFDPTLT